MEDALTENDNMPQLEFEEEEEEEKGEEEEEKGEEEEEEKEELLLVRRIYICVIAIYSWANKYIYVLLNKILSIFIIEMFIDEHIVNPTQEGALFWKRRRNHYR